MISSADDGDDDNTGQEIILKFPMMSKNSRVWSLSASIHLHVFQDLCNGEKERNKKISVQASRTGFRACIHGIVCV
jgi:hypothetical protein